MDAEINVCTAQEQAEQAVSISTPERPPYSPIMTEKNDQNEIKNEVEASNNEQLAEPEANTHLDSSEILNSSANATTTDGIEQIPMETDEVRIKEEPGIQEVNGMSVHKTPGELCEMAENLPEISKSLTEVEKSPGEGGVVGISENAGDALENTNIQSQSGETSENFLVTAMDTNVIGVKIEPGMDEENIDYGMPLSKASQNNKQVADLENTGEPTTCATLETEIPNVQQLGTHAASKYALDAFLDGIATPIAPVRPRLRVKSEFSIMPQLPREGEAINGTFNNFSNTIDTEIAPPPPVISSSSTSLSMNDGIATPSISLERINRLRVKPEYTMISTSPQLDNEEPLSVSRDFFNENNGIKRESGELSPNSDDGSDEDEAIPEDYFDDLLHDKLKEKIDEAKNNELEEKYSDRLRELERLKKENEERRKNRKKQKKAKKKSRKRTRSRSKSPGNKTKDGCIKNNENLIHHIEMKRMRKEMPSSSHYDNTVNAKDDFLGVSTEIAPVIENVEEIETVLTPQGKRERAVKRATALLQHLKRTSVNEDSNIFSSFPFVSTVRKLPTSHSYIEQQIYENRSPLHTVNNVKYKFNSHTTRLNMEEWGLAALPTHAAKLAKLVGCSAQFIHEKLKTMKIPPKLRKVKQEPTGSDAENEAEELVETTSSLYSNAMTQTDDASQFSTLDKAKSYEVAVQVEPSVYSIGCQTLETQSPTDVLHKDDEAPIMNLIRDLNENQLMALHQFAELIKEPNTNASSMQMYKIQMKIVDIYKISQIPSALDTQPSQSMNNYRSTTTNSLPQRRGGGYQKRDHVGPPHQQLKIQSVEGADGTQFSFHDPRARSTAYAQRIVNDSADPSSSSSNYNSRYPGSSQASHDVHAHPSHGRPTATEAGLHYTTNNNPTSSWQRQYPANNPAPTATPKYFGRGGLRRNNQQWPGNF